MYDSYLLLRLKSNLFVAPSEERDRENFFTEKRETNALPTKKQMCGMIECALGYRYIHDEEKEALERKIIFDTDSIVRTPKEYFKNYQQGKRTGNGWYSSFLGIRYTLVNGSYECVIEKKEKSFGKINEFVVRGEDAELRLDTIVGFNGTEEEAIRDLLIGSGGAAKYNSASDSLKKFVCKKETLDGKTSVVGVYVYPNAYVAVTFIVTARTEADIEKLLDGFEMYDLKSVAPYRIFTDLSTAKAMFEWDMFWQADGKRRKTVPPMTRKNYLSDADFLVRVYGDKNTLEEIAHALDFPVHPYYFGDRKCIPVERVNNGIWEEVAR